MLSDHLGGLVLGQMVTDRGAQRCHEFVERFCRVGVGQLRVHSLADFAAHIGGSCTPGGPQLAVTAPLHHFRRDPLIQQEAELVNILVVAERLVGPPVDERYPVGVAGCVDVVDPHVHAFVMGAQRPHDIPHNVEIGTIEHFGVGDAFALGHHHRNDDVAGPFARVGTHHSPYRLHDVDLGLARLQEHHRIERGHIHALGEDSRVGDHLAPARFGISAQAVELGGSDDRRGLAIDMLNRHLEQFGRVRSDGRFRCDSLP